MIEKLTKIEGTFCRMYVEKGAWNLYSVRGVYQHISCPAHDVGQALRLVDEYDKRAWKRVNAARARGEVVNEP